MPGYNAGKRRVLVLRRLEAATLAGLSVDHCTQLERGTAASVSESVLGAVARVLRLDEAERSHTADMHRGIATNPPGHGAAPRRPERCCSSTTASSTRCSALGGRFSRQFAIANRTVTSNRRSATLGRVTAVYDPPTSEASPGAGDPRFPLVDLTLMQLGVEQATAVDPDSCTESELIDEIQQLESLQNSLSALQANRIRAFARAHVGARIVAGVVDPDKLERAVVAQIGLACRVSPTEGRSRVRTARDLREGLDRVRALFITGELSRDKVAAIVTATADLDGRERATVDERLAAYDLARLGIGRLRDLVRKLVAEVAPEKFRSRVGTARAQRRVTLRPAPDAMTYLSAYLPVEQGVACLAALRKAFVEVSVDPAPLTRTRGQVMADTLVERVTGKATAPDVDLEVQVMVPVEALIDPDSPLPAEIPGHGPVPVELLARATGRKALRRLLTRAGIVIGGESRQRFFTGLLAELLMARAGNRCTEPYCDAPARHLDHIDRATDGGRTELDNGRATCEFHNHVREQPGWSVERTAGGVRTTTPTGHSYLAPDGPASGEQTPEDRHDSQRE